MEVGSLSINPHGYVSPMNSWTRRVGIREQDVFFFTQPEKEIRKSYATIERYLASGGQNKLLELPSEAL
jgi:hypothetical protein